jgi:hypothetical protein
VNFDLKDLKLNDLIKIAVAVTATVLLTLNFSIQSHNTTTINNYITETNKKLQSIEQVSSDTQKISNQTQGNLTKVKTDLTKNLAISKEILNQVD